MLSLAGRLAQVALVAPALARMKRCAIRMSVGGALVLVFGLFGLAYLLIALRIAVEPLIGPLWTPLAIGGGLCLIAFVAYLGLVRPLRPMEKPLAASEEKAIPAALAEPMQRIETHVAKNPLQSVAIALAAGFAATMLLRLLRRPRPQPTRSAAAHKANGHADADAWLREMVARELDRRRAEERTARP